ncbi:MULTISPECIES: RpfH protein [Xanthomonas]|uniref:RpfH protein n=1 Tax=Xanthomonas cucurbitae TaxID=56453 RepID=A0A2S7DNR5_9XANT|nr:RpfH protein [Xanthomonas cucurbitae]PPU75495.1 RpfH protein [Xanthomonas cucurbitae]QHG86950.1 RpfH protein [Xanthomonas cucurbitae]WDM69272.1 RpfH protein [Xanthomonas cucurbitae]WDM73145.1 RpfH protein [Xanthomonas cucurbitae]WDM76867.1 RpfH protein [Xanthomonas cucurbitae]
MRAVFARLRDRFVRRADSEHRQALVRVVMIGLILAYVLAFGSHWDLPDRPLHLLLRLIAIAQSGAVLLVVWIVVKPGRSHLRRTLGMLADYGLLSLAMTWFGAPLACLYVVVLWVTIGNGLRFGTHALQTAVAMAVLSFGATLANSPYWQQRTELGLALLAALVVIPMSLLRLLDDVADAHPPVAGHDHGDDMAPLRGHPPTPSKQTRH